MERNMKVNKTIGRTASLVAAAVVMFIGTSNLQAATVVAWTGPGSFNDSTIVFGGFQADTLTSVQSGGGYGHDHGSSTTYAFDVLLDGSWTNLWSQASNGTGAAQSLSMIAPPAISFSAGLISGLRLTSNPGINQTYHSLSSLTSFTFDNVNPVPVPAAIWLFGTALIGLVGFGKRRKVA